MQAIIDSIKKGNLQATSVVMVSNNSQSGAVKRAKKEGIPWYHISSKKYESSVIINQVMVNVFLQYKVDLVILAGYVKKVEGAMLHFFHGRILNIHPALLPKFGGQGMHGDNVHRAVLKAGETESGATIHVVDEEFDKGKILGQRKVPVYENDVIRTLADRILEEEHILYSDVIKRLKKNEDGTLKIPLEVHKSG